MPIALEDIQWLTSPAAEPYLARCAAHCGELTQLVGGLRKELSAERAHLVIEQVELRQRGVEKFSRAGEMFFTRQGLEQATDEQIAAYKTSRLPNDAGPAVDLCSGIGGDWLALNRWALARNASKVLGVDGDPLVMHLAAENQRRLLGIEPWVGVADVRAVDLAEFDVIHGDPDRRADGHRHTTLAELSPGEDFLRELTDRNVAWKLAPATDVGEPWASCGEREWIGSRGECRQQVLWLGRLARFPGRRVATVIAARDAPPRTIVEAPDATLSFLDAPQRFIYEPHAALLAAQLSATFAEQYALAALTSEGGYLTGEEQLFDLACAGFIVQDVLPFDLKRLKAYFRTRGIGRLEIKKRGLREEPAKVRKLLSLQGENAATLLLARVGKQSFAMVATRLEPPSGSAHFPGI
jgi:hypothetical protein